MRTIQNNPISLFLEDFLNPLGTPGLVTESRKNYPTAAVNIFETPDAYHLALNAPGRKKEDFSLQVEQSMLHLTYEAPEQKAQPEYKTIRQEFTYRSFKRSFHLDEKINAAGIQAKYEDGVLKVLLPKKAVETALKQTINIQ